MAETPRRRYVLGLGVILLVVLCWVGGDELTQNVFKNLHYDKPFCLVYFKSAMFSLYLIRLLKYIPDLVRWVVLHLTNERYQQRSPDELLGPSSYEKLEYNESDGSDMMSCSEDEQPVPSTNRSSSSRGSLLKKPNDQTAETDPDSVLQSSTSSTKRIKFRPVAEVRCLASHNLTLQREARRPYNYPSRNNSGRLSFKQHMHLALVFTLLWFLGNYLNALALEKTALSYVEILSSCSSFFVLFMGAAFPVGSRDKLTLTKMACVVVNIAGVILLSFVSQGSDVTPSEKHDNLLGIILALASALFYACYVVYFRKIAGSPDGEDDKVDIILFFGTVGALSSIFLLPLFPILNYSEIEKFEWPKQADWKYLIIVALLGTVISDLLWLWSTLLTSSLVATLGLGLTSPTSIIVDILINKKKFSLTFFIGSVLIVASFIALNIFSMLLDGDPVLDWLNRLIEHLKLKMGLTTEAEHASLLESGESDVPDTSIN